MIPEPFKHQEEAIRFAQERHFCCAFFHEMGLGKTRAAIESFKLLRVMHPEAKMLVIAPLSLLEAAWHEDCTRFAPELRFQNLRDPEKWHEGAHIYVVNFEWLWQSKNVNERLMALLAKQKFLCVIDESSKMKNFKSKTTKLLLQLRSLFMWRIVMSGTPAPNSEMEYWGQMEFVQENLLHKSFFAFRNTFFHLQNRFTGAVRQGGFMSRAEAMEVFKKFEYRITDTNRSRLMARIFPYCHGRKKKDCLDLPEQIDEVRLVKMGAKQAKHYKEMKRDLITFINDNPRNEVMAQYAMTKTMKLRELTGGFAMDDEGACHEIGETPKMDELLEVLEEAGEQQAIIWCEYRWEVERIQGLLPQAVTLYGGTKDKEDSIRRFKSGEAKYLIAHVQSAAHGLTLTNCSLQIFHSMSYSWEMHEQARARTHRFSQVNPCTYVYLICEDTIDQSILDVIRKKGSAQDLIYKVMK
jgi:SNF2 family DNA or RNA helicase